MACSSQEGSEQPTTPKEEAPVGAAEMEQGSHGLEYDEGGVVQWAYEAYEGEAHDAPWP